MKLPTRRECYQLLHAHHLTDGMIEHTELVTKIANYLAKKLKDSGLKINTELVDRGALLHDLDKYISLDGELPHGKTAAEIILAKGYDKRLAEVVENHALERILGGNLKHWEDKIVYYADKRVNHAKIVSLGERFEYLFNRYGSKSPAIMERILECKPYVFKLEEEIFSRIRDVDKSLRHIK